MRNLVALFALALGLPAAASTCEKVGDGCGIPWLTCNGEALIGATFAVQAPGTPGTPMLLVAGTLAAAPSLLPYPIACIPPGCKMHVEPLGLFVHPVGPGALATFDLAVPDDIALVGVTFAAQAAAPSPSKTCFYLSPGLKITLAAE